MNNAHAKSAACIAALGIGVCTLILLSHHRNKKPSTIPIPHPVFSIPELAEQVFLNLPTRDLLRAQRVCRQWKSVIESSPSCRKALFLEPDSSVVAFNPLLLLIYGKFRTQLLNECLSNPAASCRRMSISQPPLKFKTTSIWITMDNDIIQLRLGHLMSFRRNMGGDPFTTLVSLAKPDGIGEGATTLGELADNLVNELTLLENTDWSLVTVKDWGFAHDEREEKEKVQEPLFSRLCYNRWGRLRIVDWFDNGVGFLLMAMSELVKDRS